MFTEEFLPSATAAMPDSVCRFCPAQSIMRAARDDAARDRSELFCQQLELRYLLIKMFDGPVGTATDVARDDVPVMVAKKVKRVFRLIAHVHWHRPIFVQSEGQRGGMHAAFSARTCQLAALSASSLRLRQPVWRITIQSLRPVISRAATASSLRQSNAETLVFR